MRVVISSQDQRVFIIIIILVLLFFENEDTYFDEVIYRQLGLLKNNIFLVLGLGIIHEVLALIIFV
jgi:hypothetical protein